MPKFMPTRSSACSLVRSLVGDSDNDSDSASAYSRDSDSTRIWSCTLATLNANKEFESMPKCPSSLTLTTLDDVAETFDGVSEEVYDQLYLYSVADNRDPQDDWDPASWKAGSPNLIEKRWNELPLVLQYTLIKIAAREYPGDFWD